MHLADWPSSTVTAPTPCPPTTALVAAMDQVREVCSVTSSLRKAASLRNRLPLARLTVVVADPDALAGFEAIVADEVNVKEVVVLAADAPEAAAYGVAQRLTVNARAAGPRLGSEVQTGDPGLEVRRLVGGRGRHRHRPAAWRCSRGSSPWRRWPAPPTTTRARGAAGAAGSSSSTPRVTPELEAEGPARDLVRAVQQARRDAGLDVADRIALTVTGPDDVLGAARTHEEPARRGDPGHLGVPGGRRTLAVDVRRACA